MGINLIQKIKLFGILIFYAVWGYAQSLLAIESFPKLVYEKNTLHCKEALKIATAVFKSDSLYIYTSPRISKNSDSQAILEVQGLDISLGDAITTKQGIFEKIPKNNQAGNIYWQRTSTNGLRLVLNEEGYGWRGFQYALFSIEEAISVKQFLEQLEATTLNPIINGWRPPLILENKSTKGIWFIDFGEPYTFLGDWRIFSVADKGIEQSCVIQFRPQVEKVEALLPAEIKKFADLLDSTLGSGAGEGTLQSTASIKIKVSYIWANIIMRPWAVIEEPYNSRKTVDAKLYKWSQKSKARRKIYQAITQHYEKAQAALIQYYQRHFNMSSDQANEIAKRSMDIIFRSYFIFPRPS